MLKDVTDITVFNIQDSQCFFDMINNCVEPVMLFLQNGQTKDFRFNIELQNYLMWKDIYGEIAEVKLQCTNAQDLEYFIQFMIGNSRTKTD